MRDRPSIPARSIGATGVELTELGFGAATLGNLYAAVSDADADATVDAVVEAGIGYADTAPHYGLGLSERRLGAALARHRGAGVVVSTKVGRLLEPLGSPGGGRDLAAGFDVPAAHRRVWDLGRDGVRRSVVESLTRMGADAVDIAFLHDPDDRMDEALATAVPALIELREEGVVRAVGVGMNQSAALTTFVRETDVDVVMLAGRFTLLDQSALDDLMPEASRRGVSVVAAGVYNSGILATDTPSEGSTYDYRAAPAPIVARARRIGEVCAGHGVSLPEAALHLPLRHPAVCSVVVGMRSPAEVAENVRRHAARPPEDLWRELVEDGLVRPDAAGVPAGGTA